MDHLSSSRGHNPSAHSKSDATNTTVNVSSPSTSVAAAAPEASTLAVKLSEDPEGQVLPGDHLADSNNRHPFRDNSSSTLKEGDADGDQKEERQSIRRSRSGRLLRSTVQYDERSNRSSSPENPTEVSSHYGRRTRSSYHQLGSQLGNEGHREPPTQDDQRRLSNDSDNDSNMAAHQRVRDEYGDDNQDGLGSDEGQEEHGYNDDGDDGNNEGSESMDTNSSKNDDGSEPLIVSMYGSPSLVKVRSMFIDKLYKMVEDPAIQHLISWAKEGDMFYVYNCIDLSSSVLPKFFKHNNWQSFVRQLNMYGFHKIYRYDREESTMNRRNPETQRWQFYHPDFQRDQPHLRNNIKRKSARSVNAAPTFSRVVFERDKGYYVQQETPARPFNAQGNHGRSHSSNHPQEHHRHGQIHGGPPPPSGSMSHHYAPHPTNVHRSPHDSLQRPSAPRQVPDYRPTPGHHHPNDPTHSRDDKDSLVPKHHMSSPHQQLTRTEHEQHHHHYHGSPYHSQQQHQHQHQQQHSYVSSPHQRQHSYTGPSSQAHLSPEHGYNHKAQGFNPPPPPPQDPHHGGPPSAPGMGPGRLGGQGHGSTPLREPGYSEHGHDIKHSPMMNAGHFRSHSAPGSDPRRGEVVARGPHPFSHQEGPRSPPPPASGAQSYYSREPYASGSHPSRGHQESFDENSDAGRRFSSPPPPPGPAGLSRPSQHRQPLDPAVTVEGPSTASGAPGTGSTAGTSGINPSINPSINPVPHDLVPRTIKQLESRLHFVEDAYMSLRQFAQELQSIQTSQDQTIAWMRDRIDQMAEVGAPRDVITSPPLGQAGVVPSKRKADYSTNDQHEWSRRGPAEHQQHPGQQNYPAQGSGSMSSSTLVPPPQQQQQPSGQGSGGRYEASSFHPSFHPVHHPSQPQHPAVASQQPSQAPPPPVQQQQQQQRQHPSPPMNANAPHYQKGAVNSVLHD